MLLATSLQLEAKCRDWWCWIVRYPGGASLNWLPGLCRTYGWCIEVIDPRLRESVNAYRSKKGTLQSSGFDCSGMVVLEATAVLPFTYQARRTWAARQLVFIAVAGWHSPGPWVVERWARSVVGLLVYWYRAVDIIFRHVQVLKLAVSWILVLQFLVFSWIFVMSRCSFVWKHYTFPVVFFNLYSTWS